MEVSPDDPVFFAAVHFVARVTDEGETLTEVEYSGPFDFDFAQTFAVNVAFNDKMRSVNIISAAQMYKILQGD